MLEELSIPLVRPPPIKSAAPIGVKIELLGAQINRIVGIFTKSYDVANECILLFSCLVSDAIYKRKHKFLTKLQFTEMSLCSFSVSVPENLWGQ